MQSIDRSTCARAKRGCRSTLAFAALALVALGQAALAADSSVGLSGVVNINTASAEELQLLPGVGKARASAILALRQERGGFKTVDELGMVKGIGAPMVERLRPHLSLKGSTTARTSEGGSTPAPREP
jgi:competence protein ComEA